MCQLKGIQSCAAMQQQGQQHTRTGRAYGIPTTTPCLRGHHPDCHLGHVSGHRRRRAQPLALQSHYYGLLQTSCAGACGCVPAKGCRSAYDETKRVFPEFPERHFLKVSTFVSVRQQRVSRPASSTYIVSFSDSAHKRREPLSRLPPYYVPVRTCQGMDNTYRD